MPLFLSERDYNFIKGINYELLNEVIETTVILYSFDSELTNSNIYGESENKIYLPGITMNALIEHDDQTSDDTEIGVNVMQNILLSFNRHDLKEKDFYPERGDIAKWDDLYYEITNVIDNQLIAGRVGFKHSILCSAIRTNITTINVRQNYGNRI